MNSNAPVHALRQLLELPADPTLLGAWGAVIGLRPGQTDSALREFSSLLLQTIWESPHLSLRAIAHVSAAIDGTMDDASRARLYRLTGHGFRAVGKAAEAAKQYKLARTYFLRTGDHAEVGRTAIGYVYALALLGRSNDALSIAKEGRRKLPRDDLQARGRLELNLALAFLRAGRHRIAERRYRRAMQVCEEAQDAAGVGACLHHLGMIASRQGHVEQAIEFHTNANAHLESANLPVAALYCKAALALAEMSLGDWEVSLKKLRKLRAQFEDVGDQRAEALVRRDLASGLARLGVVEAAAEEGVQAFRLLRQLGLDDEEARLALFLGRLFAEKKWHEEAQCYLQQARTFYRASGDQWMTHRASVELASALVASGDVAGGLELLRPSRRYLERVDPSGDGVLSLTIWAEAQLARRRASYAETAARKARRRAKRYPAVLLRPRLALCLARACALRNRHAQAVTWAERAASEQEDIWRKFGDRGLRDTLSESRSRIFAKASAIVAQHGGRRAGHRALELIAQSRSALLLEDCLQSQRSGHPARGLRTALEKLRDDLLERPLEVDAQLRNAGLREEIEYVSQKLVTATRGAAPMNRALRGNVEEWSARLGQRELVLFDRDSEGWQAFVVRTNGSIDMVRLTDLDTVLRDNWGPLQLTLKAAARAPQGRRGDFVRRTQRDSVARLDRIGAAIWDRVELNEAEAVVVPYGELHNVPLEALSASGNITLTRLPHPSLVRPQRSSQHRSLGDALVLHGPAKGTEQEAVDVAQQLTEAGFRTTRGDQRGLLGESRKQPWKVLHIAAHGSLHPEGWLLSALQLADGWLGFEALERRTVRDSLVYMSSCESGVVNQNSGANLQGWLASGLAAGARELILSLWKLDDRSASRFAELFYDEWRTGSSAAHSAVLARRKLRQEQPHPFSWAPFIAVG